MAMADRMLISLFEHKAWCNARLAEALLAAPKDLDRRQWAVVVFTFDHTNIVDRVFKARLTGEIPDASSTVATTWPDLSALAARMAETDAWFIDYARRVTAEELETVVDFAFVDDGARGG
jgi:uncharacterized damage-inducible protein DinB